mgnify:FL=1
MKTRELFIVAIVLGSLLAFFVSLKVRKIPIEPNHHHHHPHKRIGGCKGTRYGCCPHSRKARADKKGSNCHHHHESPHTHHH